MTFVMFLCLSAIAVNAVLIQTITTDDSMLKNGVRVGVLGLAAFAMLMHNSRFPLGIFMLVTFCVMVLALRQNTDQLSLIFVFVLVPALFAVKERALGKLFMVTSAGSLLLIFAFLAAGITHNEVLELRGRNTFGTNGVPFFYNVVYGALTMLLVYVHKFKLRLRHVWTLVALGLATHLFNLTDARGGYYAFLAFVGLLYFMPLLGRMSLVRGLTVLLPVGFLGAAFYIASLWDDGAANKLLSIRPILYQRFLDSLTPSDYFLSSTVKQFARAITIVDNSYLHLLIGGGITLFVIFVLMFGQAVLKMYRMGKFVDLAFVIATCIYFNSESILLRIENMFVIYFWYLVIRYSTPLLKHEPTIKQTPVPAVEKKPAKVKAEPLPAWAQVSRPVPARHLPEWARQGRTPVKDVRPDA
jgi:O-antigen ligase